jgi:hypothetical protein
MKYHHQENGIPNTRFMLVLVDHGSRTNVRDPYIFYNLSGEFSHKLHYFKAWITYLEEASANTKYHHQHRGIPNTRFMSVLVDHGSSTNERDPYILYNLSREFAHKLH